MGIPTLSEVVAVHPVQVPRHGTGHSRHEVAQVVTLRAYEVYKHVYGEQQDLVTGSCRGGFGVGELIAFLHAASFPREEWKARVDEAFRGMVGL